MAFLKRLIFDKETSKVYCENTEGRRYAEFPICFNFWRYDGSGNEHSAIENDTYEINHDTAWDMDYGTYQGEPYGDFWIALNRDNEKGFHGWDEDTHRSLTSGTFGCIRGENADGEQICRAIDEALDNGITVTADVVGDVPDSEFCLDDTGEQ